MASIYYYRLSDPKYYAKWKAIMEWLVAESTSYKNMEIYSLATDSYASDLRNYRDEVHYEITGNVMEIDAIAGKQRLTPKNMKAFLTKLDSLVKNYDLKALQKQLQDHLKTFPN